MKKIIVYLLFLHMPFLASDRLPLIDITQIATHQENFNGLDYTALMQKKLQYQGCVDSVMQSLVCIDEKVRLIELNVSKYSQLLQKEETLMQEIQENLSLDVAHDILAQYNKRDKEKCLSFDERWTMFSMDLYLEELRKQIQDAVSINKNIGISQILASWPCYEIKANLTSLSLSHQYDMLALYQENMQQHQDDLDVLSAQKTCKIQEQSCINSALARINELIPELLTVRDQKNVQNIKSVILLQSLYRMKLSQKKPQVSAWRKYRAIKHDVIDPILEDICDQAFTSIQVQEKAKLIAAWEMQELLDKQEKERKQDQKVRLQQQAEKEKEALRLQEIAAVKVQKSQLRKAAKQAEKQKEQQAFVIQENIRLAAIAKDEAETALLDALIIENRRKNVNSLVTLAENNIENIKDVFQSAIKNEKPLNKAMSVVSHYVEHFGVLDFNAKKFLNSAIEQARIVKGHNFQKADAEKRAVVLQGIMQAYFESIIKNNDSCVAPCLDVQAANLAKLHNLLVDFIEDKFDL